MMISIAFFSSLITIAIAITAVAPLLLLALLFRDWKRGRLW